MKITPLIRVLAVTLLSAAFASLQAAPLTYQASLSGAAEVPVNDSAGTGTATVIYDSVAHTMQVMVIFSGLTGTVTASHIHAATAIAGVGTAGVATSTPTFTGFPSGVTFGNYDHTFDLTSATSWNAAFITANGGTTSGAEAALASALANGKSYLNIHTTYKTGGEIRGFLNAVPDSSATLPLLLLGIGGLAGAARYSRKRLC